MHLHMYMCRELTYIFTGNSYFGVGIWKPKIMYYLNTSMNVTIDISFCISDLYLMGLPSGSLLLSLLIMVFKFHVFS